MTQTPQTPPGNSGCVYDSSNIFAKILRKEISSVPVYEDAQILAFMDIMPQAEGHMVLIPKAPCRNLLDADPQILPHCIQIVQKLAQAAQKALSAAGIAVMQFNEAAAGQSVFHLHFHIIPRFAGQNLKPHGSAPAAPEELAATAAKIRAALAAA